MKTPDIHQRIERIAGTQAFRSLGINSSHDLTLLIENELGHIDILDRPIARTPDIRLQALPPQSIYHVCASNLDVSALSSLMLGLLLGSRLQFKLPSSGLPAFQRLVEELNRQGDFPLIECFPEHDAERMRAADAVVVYGSDQTIANIRLQTHWQQRFLGYGHKVSIGLLPPASGTRELAEKATTETIAYEQAGCLSPQAYLCANMAEAEQWCDWLAEALEKQETISPSPARSFEEKTLLFEARQQAKVRGNKLWGDETERPWTVVLRDDGFFEPGPGMRFIQVIPGSDWFSTLKPWKGKVSALSLPADLGEELQTQILDQAIALGISRLCPMGQLQQPSLLWQHDGRPQLADLVTWITLES